MRRSYLLLFISIIFVGTSINAQLLEKVGKFIGSSGTNYTEQEAINGIKEALVKGTAESVNLVSVADGFWKNDEIRIPFPSEAKKMEEKLRKIGMGKQVDEFNESINRAAEKAASEAQPIFVEAIKNITITDAINIVKGDSTAATIYLQNATTTQLSAKFKPIIEEALKSVNSTKYWGGLTTTYNKLPFVKKMDTDLARYVTDKSIKGLFIMIAKEESKIRENSSKQTTALLKKVFGN